jgi:hypothetical protein
VTPDTAAALEAVALRLQAAGVPFLLGGSALLAALGLDVTVRDIDLVARPEDRTAVERAAGGWWRRTDTAPTPLFRSPWKAELDVDGVAVEVLGGLAWTLADGGPAAAMPFRADGVWRCGRAEVPLAPAAHWLLLYERHRPDRAAQLARIVAPEARTAALDELARQRR